MEGIWNRAAQGPSCDCRRRHHTPAGAGDSTAPRVVAEAHRRRGRGGIRGGRVAAWRGGGAPRRLSRLQRSATSRRATCGGQYTSGYTTREYGKRNVTERNVTRRDATRRDAARRDRKLPSAICSSYLLLCILSRGARLRICRRRHRRAAPREFRADPPAIFDEPPSDSKVRSSTYTVQQYLREGEKERKKEREREREWKTVRAASARNERAGVERG